MNKNDLEAVLVLYRERELTEDEKFIMNRAFYVGMEYANEKIKERLDNFLFSKAE